MRRSKHVDSFLNIPLARWRALLEQIPQEIRNFKFQTIPETKILDISSDYCAESFSEYFCCQVICKKPYLIHPPIGTRDVYQFRMSIEKGGLVWFVHDVCTEPDAYKMTVFLIGLWLVHSTNWRFFLRDIRRKGPPTRVLLFRPQGRLRGHGGKLYWWDR